MSAAFTGTEQTTHPTCAEGFQVVSTSSAVARRSKVAGCTLVAGELRVAASLPARPWQHDTESSPDGLPNFVRAQRRHHARGLCACLAAWQLASGASLVGHGALVGGPSALPGAPIAAARSCADPRSV